MSRLLLVVMRRMRWFRESSRLVRLSSVDERRARRAGPLTAGQRLESARRLQIFSLFYRCLQVPATCGLRGARSRRSGKRCLTIFATDAPR